MKFTSLVESLKRSVVIAERATGKKLTLPILGNLLLRTEKGQLKISATDLEIGLNVYVAGKAEEDDGVAISAKTLSGFLANLSEEKVIIESKDNTLKAKSGNYEAMLQGMPYGDFPIIPEIKTDKYIEIDNDLLANSLNQVINSAGYSSGRSELNGIYIDFNEQGFKIAATDSFRLSEKSINLNHIKTNSKEGRSAIIPLRTAQEVLKICQEFKSGDGAKVKIYLDSNQILFDFGSLTLISRLLEGNYPKYENIIPAKFETKAMVAKRSFYEAAKITGLFSSKINDIKLKIKPEQKEITIEAQDAALGQGQSKIDAKIEGEPLEISFNYRYLLDGLNNINSNQVFIGFNQDTGPALLKASDDGSYIYILMPIKI